MVLSPSQYLKIRNLIFHIGCNDTKLYDLKLHFKNHINSQRVFERINTLPYLVKILEKRDCLGPDQVDRLLCIINKVAPDNVEIKTFLFDGEVNTIHRNSNRDLNMAMGNTRGLQEIRVIPPVPSDAIQEIHEMIKSKIGFKWKELARALSVPEGQIDNLEYQYRLTDVSRMIHEVLRFHQEKCGSQYELWRSKLQQGLEKARRKDLSEDIDEILKFKPVHM